VNAAIVLEWSFSPHDYFEEAIEICRKEYTMTIANGQVHARIDSAIYSAYPDMRWVLHDALNDRFLGVQLLTHRAYELSRPTMSRVYPDGHKDIFIEAEPGHFAISGGVADSQVIDKDGNVIADSKRERLEKKRSLAELVTAHRATDVLLAALLRSHAAAVHDPNNELVHLYEIRDALSTRFGRENATRTSLGISASQWSRFGQLCNSEPLRQGRHRGKAGGVLRDATEDEPTEARRIARVMIEAYLQHVEASTSP